MRPVGECGTVEEYVDFGRYQAGDSPCFAAWALGLAEDPEVVALVETLPRAKRQPNLVFAAARWHGARTGPYEELRSVLLSRWPEVEATVLARATQTNEVGRCATLLPALAGLAAPGEGLALIEVGCSAGLCLLPDRYSYRYATPQGTVGVDPPGGVSPVVVRCEVHAGVPVPEVVPRVAWRRGVDLHPLDVADPDAVAWLAGLVWPEHHERRARLAAAVRLARADPPVLVAGDLLEVLPDLVAQVPAGLTPVVFHSAVAAYLSTDDRERLVELMTGLMGGRGSGPARRPLHWVSNEGPQVLPGLQVPEAPPDPSVGASPFLLSLDATPVAWTHGHGTSMSWI